MVQSKQQVERERERIRRDFSASLMSVTKWRKLFSALDRSDLNLHQAIFKFIDVEQEFRMRIPKRGNLHPPRAYIDTLDLGPVSLRSIEWLELPKVAEYHPPSEGPGQLPVKPVPQDVDRVPTILGTLGKFPIEYTERGLRIVGHVRRTDSMTRR